MLPADILTRMAKEYMWGKNPMPHDPMSEGLKCSYAGASDIKMTGRQITAKVRQYLPEQTPATGSRWSHLTRCCCGRAQDAESGRQADREQLRPAVRQTGIQEKKEKKQIPIRE